MEQTGCVICGTGGNDVAITENGYSGRKCPDCKHIYISPRPSPDEIHEMYDEYQEDRGVQGVSLDPWRQRFLCHHTLKIVQEWVPDGDLLEVGAGSGEFVSEASKAGFDTKATELDPSAAEFIRSNLGIDCEPSTLENVSFESGSFDAIYHRNVISHFHDPVSEFRKMNDLLRDNGIVVFETGNYAEIGKEYDKYINKYQYPDHLNLFSEKSVKKLLHKTGFECVEIRRYSKMVWLLMLRVALPLANLTTSALSGGAGSGQASGDGSSRNSTRAKSAIGTLLKGIWHTTQFISMYKLGRYLPKGGRPQNMIVVARKVGGTAQS